MSSPWYASAFVSCPPLGLAFVSSPARAVEEDSPPAKQVDAYLRELVFGKGDKSPEGGGHASGDGKEGEEGGEKEALPVELPLKLPVVRHADEFDRRASHEGRGSCRFVCEIGLCNESCTLCSSLCVRDRCLQCAMRVRRPLRLHPRLRRASELDHRLRAGTWT